MQHAGGMSVLGDFNSARYRYHDVTTTFFQRDGGYYVNSDGPDGRMQDFEIKFTFGVYPMQQYLVEMPGGRMQALGVAWDSRPRAEGGQKWFHLYPKEKVDHNDELHWTKLSQNWNYMCAECHSTNLKKNYDLASNRFSTTWSEINVSCEACHGPASRHVEWANRIPGAESIAQKGLAVLLDARKSVTWNFSPAANTATRSETSPPGKEIEMCARCHSRRSTLTEDYRHGRPLMDTHLPALLTEYLYYPDGQVNEEDYEYGSFIQSKMFHKGVTCSDCHDPHTQKLRAPGNETCLQCHRAETFASAEHHHHPMESKGAVCAGCHMPTTNFMVIHARHDHSIRIPRPDLSVRLGTPNACTQCHADKEAAWADAQIKDWYGPAWAPGWHFGETLHEAIQGMPQAGPDLAAVTLSPQVPDIARATAASLLANYLEPTTGVVLPKLLANPSPMVRHSALAIVEQLPAERRWVLAGTLLSDSVRAVRIEAGRVLAAAQQGAPTPALEFALESAVGDYVSAQLESAEHPQSHVNLGLLYQDMGNPDKAERAYLQAIALDPAYVAAHVNLADLYRVLNKDAKAEETLVKARTAIGENAAVEHALGLLYVRTRQMPNALASLALAARLLPDNARYVYVYAVALNSNGDASRAIEILEAVNVTHPYDRDVLIALVSFHKSAGNMQAAMEFAGKLANIDPRYGSEDQILQQSPLP